MNQKISMTDKFLKENERLNERIGDLESNQANQYWKGHFKKLDDI
jgi:hypothetical protein